MSIDRREQTLLRVIESWQDEDGNTYADLAPGRYFYSMMRGHFFDSVIRRAIRAPGLFPSDTLVRSLEAPRE